jgi:hypothetical protein
MEGVGQNATSDDLRGFGYFHLLEDEPRQALDDFRNGFARDGDFVCGLNFVLLADAFKEVQARDQTLNTLCDNLRYASKRTQALAKLFREALRKGPRAPLDLKGFERYATAPRDEGGRMLDYFLIGRFLAQRGEAAESRKYLRRCADSLDAGVWIRALAAHFLQEQRSGQEKR